MSVLPGLLFAPLAIAAIVAMYWAWSWSLRRRSLTRLSDSPRAAEPQDLSAPHRWLRDWLSLAGYRRPDAPVLFLWAMGAALVLSLLAAEVLAGPRAVNWMLRGLSGLPGGVGALFEDVVRFAFWIELLVLASTPVLVVRRARRQRIEQVEQDLPLCLELFATLAEAGLGFDAALSRILESQPPNRVLASELRQFQAELLAGTPRVQALRQLAKRTGVSGVTLLVSALVHAEQVGASLSGSMRRQADDLRDRRRQQALASAQALPVKLVFPLALCFLPGIFVSILGPAIHQLLRVADAVLQAR